MPSTLEILLGVFFKQAGSDADLIAEWAVPCLFRVLQLQDIITFYTALLLERTVVVVCEQPGTLSAVVYVHPLGFI
jgi:hypothetical protein